MEPSKKLEQVMVDHVEMLFGVAVRFTQDVGEAERLTRKTIAQALQCPEQFEDVSFPKRDLLKMMRNNIGASFVERLFANDSAVHAMALMPGKASRKKGIATGLYIRRECVSCEA
jgi:hypothetical protein